MWQPKAKRDQLDKVEKGTPRKKKGRKKGGRNHTERWGKTDRESISGLK